MAKSNTTEAEEAKAADALELVRDLQQTFTERNDLYAYIDRVLYLDEPVFIPEKYRSSTVEVRTPLALHTVNTVSAALSVNPPEVQFDPVSIGDVGMENSTRREHFFDASWEQQQQEAGRRIFRPFMYSLVGKGEAVMKTLERRKRAWAQYDTELPKLTERLKAEYGGDHAAYDRAYDTQTEQLKRGLLLPYTTQDVPPENFYYIRGEQGFSTCVERKFVPYYETLQKYEYGLDSQGRICEAAASLPETEWSKVMGRHKARTLELIEVWTCKDVRYLLLGPGDSLEKRGGKLVHTVKHGYGDPDTQTLRGPYFHCLGITTSSRNVATMGVSIIFGFLRLYGLLNSLLTMQQQAAFRYAFTAYKRRQQPGYGMPDNVYALAPGPDQGSEQIVDVQPGDILPWDIDPIELGHAGVDLDKAIGLVRELLELALPQVVQGVMADSSGYAISQAAHLARLIWDPIVDNAEMCLAQRVGFESWLIQNQVKENVYVFGDLPGTGRRVAPRGVFSIGPDDLNGVHRYRVRLEPETPSNEVIKLRAIAEAMQLRVMGPYQAITELGRNPDEVEKEWLVYDVKHSPEVQQVLMQRTFEKLGIVDQQTHGEDLARYGGPPPGTPPGAALGGVGEVPMPGQNMPLQPPVPAMNGAQTPPPMGQQGPGPGSIGPTPVLPNPPGPSAG